MFFSLSAQTASQNKNDRECFRPPTKEPEWFSPRSVCCHFSAFLPSREEREGPPRRQPLLSKVSPSGNSPPPGKLEAECVSSSSSPLPSFFHFRAVTRLATGSSHAR